jgi:hypothetical protein
MFVQAGGEICERDPGHGPGPEGLQAPQGGIPPGVHRVRTSGTVSHRCGPAVLLIRDVFLDPVSDFFRSWIRIFSIPDPHLKYFNPEKWFPSSTVGKMIRVVHPGSGS